MRKTVLITGANRGLGLGLVTYYLDHGWQVIATCRSIAKASQLQEFAIKYPLSVFELDVGDVHSRSAFAEELQEHYDSLDLVIHNAGVLGVARDKADNVFEKVTEAMLMDTFRTNSVAPFLFTQQLLPLLRNSEAPLVVTISSIWGSIANVDDSGFMRTEQVKPQRIC